MSDGHKVLVGKTITAVWLAADKKAMRFDVEGGEQIIAKADGDCCSDTWIESLDAVEALVGGTVAEVRDLTLDREESGEYGDVTQFYGCAISTEKGVCTIDYRNSSNGYYGGSLAWPGGYFYGGVYGQNVSEEEWEEATP